MLNNISMKLYETYPICKQSVNIPFEKLFSNLNKDEIIKNKGKAGQLMENLCGLKLSNATRDFEDGELKTSELKESTAITMITSWIDEIIHENPIAFEKSRLLKKIEHIIFMPLEKPSSNPIPQNGILRTVLNIPITKGTKLYEQIENDYNNICKLSHEQVYKKKISNIPNFKTTSKSFGDGFLHTTSGKFIQIRTKDAGGSKSKPIFSKKLKRNVTKVSRMAFYFLASFKYYVDKNFK